MALHGDIRVNDRRIGVWSATRLREEGMDGEYQYKCEVAKVMSSEGYDFAGPAAKFKVHHTHTDGAFVLMSKVIAEGSRILGGEGTH